MLDGTTLRAHLTPKDPSTQPAMSGILLASTTANGTSFEGELRVSNEDGSLVRGAPVHLERAPASER
jgi:hypothetical protein